MGAPDTSATEEVKLQPELIDTIKKSIAKPRSSLVWLHMKILKPFKGLSIVRSYCIYF